MLVMHGIWVYGALWLWAEDSERPAGSAPQPGRPSRAPRPHPFACDVSVLADALAELPDPVTDLVRKAVEDELTLFLPSTAEGPAASPELIRLPAGDREVGQRSGSRRPALAAWRIPALTFEPAPALSLLTALGNPALGDPALGDPALGDPGLAGAGLADPALADSALSNPPPGDPALSDPAGDAGRLGVAGSVLYLAALARMADDLAGRGRVLPQLAGRRGLDSELGPGADRGRRAASGRPSRGDAATLPRHQRRW